MIRVLSRSAEETAKIAQDLIKSIYPENMSGKVIALEGDLGSGKTTFVQGVGWSLGIKEKMHSPTFVIEKVYPIKHNGFEKLIHLDAYRIEREEELVHLGWDEIIRDRRNLIFVEWPENVSGLIPDNAMRVHFKFIDENTREITYEKSSK